MGNKKENKREFPDYSIYRYKPPKNSAYIIFHRNNLSLEHFKRIDDGFLFEEDFTCMGISGNIQVIVHDVNLRRCLFECCSKRVKIQGNAKQFGITLRLPNKTQGLVQEMNTGSIFIRFACDGVLPSERESHKMRGIKSSFHNGKVAKASTQFVTGDPWSAMHPFKGGSVTPK